MRSVVVALAIALVPALAAGCSDDEPSGAANVDSDAAQTYLAELDDAGLRDLFEDDEQAVEFVAVSCEGAVELGQTPEDLIASGAVSEQAAIALKYCDTDLGG